MNTRQRWTLVITSVASLMTTLDVLVVTTGLARGSFSRPAGSG